MSGHNINSLGKQPANGISGIRNYINAHTQSQNDIRLLLKNLFYYGFKGSF